MTGWVVIAGPAPSLLWVAAGQVLSTAHPVTWHDDRAAAVAHILDLDPGYDVPDEGAPLPVELPSVEQSLAALSVASRLTLDSQLRAGDLDDTVIAAVAPLYPPWRPDLTVETGDVLAWDGTLVEAIQPHTTQPDWTPDVTPALWKIHRSPDAGPAPWVQPAGAHDAYQAGEQVTYDGHVWTSDLDGNVWRPGEYGWTKADR